MIFYKNNSASAHQSPLTSPHLTTVNLNTHSVQFFGNCKIGYLKDKLCLKVNKNSRIFLYHQLNIIMGLCLSRKTKQQKQPSNTSRINNHLTNSPLNDLGKCPRSKSEKRNINYYRDNKNNFSYNIKSDNNLRKLQTNKQKKITHNINVNIHIKASNPNANNKTLNLKIPNYGEFKCPNCNRSWASACSWADTKQKCIKCKTDVRPHILRSRENGNFLNIPVDKSKPHQQALCEKCKKLGYSCYSTQKQNKF